jgi:hypothetical protein
MNLDTPKVVVFDSTYNIQFTVRNTSGWKTLNSIKFNLKYSINARNDCHKLSRIGHILEQDRNPEIYLTARHITYSMQLI